MRLKIAAGLVLATVLGAKDLAMGKKNRLYRISQVALIAANSLDIHSSWGRLEANPILTGKGQRFGYRGVAIKAGALGGWLWWSNRKLRENNQSIHRSVTFVNFAAAGGLGVVIKHNYGLRK